MPLYFHKKITDEGELGIWEVKENASYFLDQLNLSSIEKKDVETLKGRRQIEWLAARWLLHLMSGREKRGACLKDKFGKPYLVNSPYQVSISHSHGLVSIIAAPQQVGVDIQFLVSKIERIAHKFMRPEESKCLSSSQRIEHLHVFWGAKEALYKAYGRRKLDFREHIIVHPFNLDYNKGVCTGLIKKNNFEAFFDIYYKKITDYILVYALQQG